MFPPHLVHSLGTRREKLVPAELGVITKCLAVLVFHVWFPAALGVPPPGGVSVPAALGVFTKCLAE